VRWTQKIISLDIHLYVAYTKELNRYPGCSLWHPRCKHPY